LHHIKKPRPINGNEASMRNGLKFFPFPSQSVVERISGGRKVSLPTHRCRLHLQCN